MALVLYESLIDASCHFVNVSFIIEKSLLIACGDVSKLYQTAWHRCLAQYEEASLLHALVGTPCGGAYVMLHKLGKVNRLVHVVVLHKLKDDVAL